MLLVGEQQGFILQDRSREFAREALQFRSDLDNGTRKLIQAAGVQSSFNFGEVKRIHSANLMQVVGQGWLFQASFDQQCGGDPGLGKGLGELTPNQGALVGSEGGAFALEQGTEIQGDAIGEVVDALLGAALLNVLEALSFDPLDDVA
ncbi:MAG: hypothetical protein A2Z16_15665 [Chloroflexi bacterium RBG_16_54_18]|nr:MAG: hypothetical protein A2Z16_15665 [Chloroflexi bacterium RBG_16_54_18]